MVKFINQYKYKPKDSTLVYGPSLTEPDQSMSVKEILARSMAGLSVIPQYEPEDDELVEQGIDDEFLPEVGDFDYVDLMNLRSENRRRVAEIEEAQRRKEVLPADSSKGEAGVSDSKSVQNSVGKASGNDSPLPSE